MTRKNDTLNDRLGGDAESFHQALMDAHEGLTFEQCVRMDTRLILILASHIGDIEVLKAALIAARQGAK